MSRSDGRLRRLAALTLLLFALAPAARSQGPAPVSAETARLAVRGAGFFRDRELQAALSRLLGRQQAKLDTNAIEDAAVILVSALGDEGYLHAAVDIVAELEDGGTRRFTFDPTFATPLPRPLHARAVTFELRRGVRYTVDTVRFNGLSALPERQARALFRSDAALFLTARSNAFSPARLNRSADALLGELRQRGRVEAGVRTSTAVNERSGRVAVTVDVREGPAWTVTDMSYQRDEGDGVPLPPASRWLGRAWSPTLQEDVREAIRHAYYERGYPDVGVHVVAEAGEQSPAGTGAGLVATIVAGPRVTMGQARFEGAARMRESVLRRRVQLAAGAPLDLMALEHARYRLSRLGLFEAVELRFEPADGTVRDPVFRLREGPRYETSLLFGYGSYEQVRGGVEHRQRNLFGLAHQSRLELVQSMKSSSGDYTYTVPELFGESLDGTGRLFGLQRKEIAFLRQEYGVNVALKRPVRRIGGEVTAGYTFQALRNRRSSLSTRTTDERQLNVASLLFAVGGDRRDNPLRPRSGYHWSTQVELADPRLGSQATYQRSEFAAAYHTRWGGSRWIHAGVSHGVITTAGATDVALPVNKRFFPGGDSSIRGYKRGQAAPRGADGLFVGAKSVVLVNVELEQAVTPNWSAVLFWDGLGMTESLRDYPMRDRLHTAGAGVRYQTLIGPVRLEYGRNLNPRPDDPSGTWQFSVGYPF
jgi:outer membrane protein assembly factor BamA